MKKIATKFSVVALLAVALTSCNKKTNDPPEADKEFNSAVEASVANFIATDIEQMVSQASEYSYIQFYTTAGFMGSNSLNRDTVSKVNTLTFNQSTGVDGVYRNGVVTVNYQGTTGSTAYMRNPGHISNVTFNNFTVGKYVIDNSSNLKLTNTTAAGYSRSVTPLTWKIEGTLKLKDTTDGNTEVTWTGSLNKTLVNSTSNTIHPSASLPLVWTTTNNAVKSDAINAIVKYTGETSGTSKNGSTYMYKIDDERPVHRYFGCSPDYYINPEQHPFSKGKVIFTTGDKSVRFVYYGDQDDNMTCDNSTVVIIEGVSYKVDLKYQ
ncbi:MAG: hypothetical protein AB7O73_12540 [Bacteroidia bacterium]